MFTLLLALMMIERALLLSWNRSCLGWGVSVLKRSIPLTVAALGHFSLAQVESTVEQTRWPALRFHRLSEHSYAFRETSLVIAGAGYPPITRRHIAIDRKHREIVITGFCNWTVVHASLSSWCPPWPSSRA